MLTQNRWFTDVCVVNFERVECRSIDKFDGEILIKKKLEMRADFDVKFDMSMYLCWNEAQIFIAF